MMESVMFKKIPYGVKVRVKGNEETGYVAQYAISCIRFLPFLDIWSNITRMKMGGTAVRFDSLEDAQDFAMRKYNSWISYFKAKEAEDRERSKVSNKIVWKHP